jgi:histidinol-phosphate aminotransferase
MPLHLVIGGVRSGKSELAERLAGSAGAPVCLVATGSPGDPEMVERIARHRRRRPAGWRTVESDDPPAVLGLAPPPALPAPSRWRAAPAPPPPAAQAGPEETVLVDGIGSWVARLMVAEGLWTEAEVEPLGRDGETAWERLLDQVRAFAHAAATRPGLTVVVAEEGGLGLLPLGAGARRYLDLMGEATQLLARAAAQVRLVVAGQVVALEPTTPPRLTAAAGAAAPAGPAVPAPPAEAGPVQVPGAQPASRPDLPGRVDGDDLAAPQAGPSLDRPGQADAGMPRPPGADQPGASQPGLVPPAGPEPPAPARPEQPAQAGPGRPGQSPPEPPGASRPQLPGTEPAAPAASGEAGPAGDRAARPAGAGIAQPARAEGAHPARAERPSLGLGRSSGPAAPGPATGGPAAAGRSADQGTGGRDGARRPGPLPAAAAARDVPARLRLHGDAVAAPGQLDFAVNVIPGGPPAWLRAELIAALNHAGSYPDQRPAIAAIAGRHRRDPGEVLLTNGSAEAFWLLANVLRPARSVVVHPSFTEPEVALRVAGHTVQRCHRRPESFAFDPDAVPDDADLVVVGNPNNPTGNLDRADQLAGLARPGRVLLVDEAFIEFTGDEAQSLAGRGDLPGLVVVRSLTKVWALPGVRAGYLLCAPDLAATLRAARQPWSVNAVACAALAACAADRATTSRVAERVAAAREELVGALGRLPGVRVWPSVANFLLLQVPAGPAVRSGLAERGIAVRPADSFPGLGPDHLRIAVRSPEDNRRLVAALDEVLG